MSKFTEHIYIFIYLFNFCGQG